jgi:hypothetical protein
MRLPPRVVAAGVFHENDQRLLIRIRICSVQNEGERAKKPEGNVAM